MNLKFPCIHIESNEQGLHEVQYMGLEDGDKYLAYGEGESLDEAIADLISRLGQPPIEPQGGSRPLSPQVKERLGGIQMEADRVHATPVDEQAALIDIRVTVPDHAALLRELEQRKQRR